MAKGYIIYNKKSKYYYTKFDNFDEFNIYVKIFPTKEEAEKYIPVAIRNQIFELLELIYNKSRLEIDITQEEYDNIKEHIDLEVKGLYMATGDA